MSIGDSVSILINLAVGIYFLHFYPRLIAKRFASRPAPRGFVMLQKVVPPIGGLIVVLTLIYAATLLLGD